MKKGTRIVKKSLALFLVVLMSINTFAAVVGDNDGAAFITKAEFDSLKNDFQSQLDRYNSSIDNKIDGAIANYLAGVSVSKTTTYKVETADWKEIIATNHVLDETWTKPNLNITFNYQYCNPNWRGEWFEIWWASAALVYNKPDSVYQIRNLVDAGIESTTTTFPDYVTWLGQSCNLTENINIVKTGVCPSVWDGTQHSGGDNQYVHSYLVNATTPSASMDVIYGCQLDKGYVPLMQPISAYHGQYYWTGSNIEIYPEHESDWLNASIDTGLSLGYVSDKQYQYEHILTYDNYNFNNLTAPTWTHTLGSNATWNEDDVINDSDVDKSGRWAVFEINDAQNHNYTASSWMTNDSEWWSQSSVAIGTTTARTLKYVPTNRNFRNFLSGKTTTAPREVMMASVGVLDTTYKSEKILQWSGKRKLNRDENILYEKINLYNGALIAYAKQGETFKWEPKITGTYDNSGTSVAIKKWRVELSDKPFGTGSSLGAGGKALKNAGQTNDYLVTDDDGKCKFNFELGDNTTIWCKWWPDDSNICNNYNWEGTLDLTQCGTYTITGE